MMTDKDSEAVFDATLAHYGVKGMKWGRRKRDDGGGSSGKSEKSYPTGKEIKEARKSVNAKYNKVIQLDVKARNATTAAERKSAVKEINDIAKQTTTDELRTSATVSKGQAFMVALGSGAMGLRLVEAEAKNNAYQIGEFFDQASKQKVSDYSDLKKGQSSRGVGRAY